MLDHILDDASKSILGDLQTHLRYDIEHGQLNVPTPPAIAWQFIPASPERKIDAVKLWDKLDQNPLLRQQILKLLSNCSGQSELITINLDDALDHFGAKHIAVLAFALILREQVYVTSQEERRFLSLWQHAVASAMFAKHLNEAAGLDLEPAFIAGLLHDIGKPVILHTLLHAYGQQISAIPSMVTGAILEAYHEEVGRIVAESWELEAEIADAIVYHHDCLMAPLSPQLATLIHLADAFTHHLFTPAIHSRAALRQHPALGMLNIDNNIIACVLSGIDRIKAAVQELS